MPRCSACAAVRPLPNTTSEQFRMRRLACPSSGLVKDKKAPRASFGTTQGPVDCFFELPLWLVANQGTLAVVLKPLLVPSSSNN